MAEANHRRARYQFGTLTQETRKRGPNVWVYRFCTQIDGKKTRPKVILGTVQKFPTRVDALRESEHLRIAANAESVQPQVSMRGLIDQYIEEILKPCLDVPPGGMQDEAARMSWGCAERYRSVLRNRILPRWQDYSVSEFEKPRIRSAVEKWFESLWRSARNPKGLAPMYVGLIRAVMAQVFKFAVKWGYLDQNPMTEGRVDLPRGSTKPLKRAAQLTPVQFFQLLSLLPPREKVAVAFAGWLGPRGSEVFGLKWRDLDLDTEVVTFRQGLVDGRITWLKTEASRTDMPVPAEVVKLLREWRLVTPYNTPEDWVFASVYRKGTRPLAPQTMMERIQRVARRAGLPPITWHSFRHSLSAWGKECLKLEEVKTVLRHADITTTSNIYGRPELNRKREIQKRLVRRVRKLAGAHQPTASAIQVQSTSHETSPAPERTSSGDLNLTHKVNGALEENPHEIGSKPRKSKNLRKTSALAA